MSTQAIITALLAREGGFVDHLADRGGPTNFGITQGTLGWWLGRTATLEDVKNLTPDTARTIYQTLYIDKPGFSALTIPSYLFEQIVDFSVNSGPILVITKLQQLVGTETDGKLGPITVAAINQANHLTLNNDLVVARILMIGRLISKDLSQGVFALGWLSRACSFFRWA